MAVLEHCALFVSDLESSKEFYCRWFGAKANKKYHNPRTRLTTYFLTFEGGARLEIMSRPDITKPAGNQQLGYAHIAFTVGTRNDVDSLANELEKAGFTITSGPRTTGDGYYEAVVLDPEGNHVEFVAEEAQK